MFALDNGKSNLQMALALGDEVPAGHATDRDAEEARQELQSLRALAGDVTDPQQFDLPFG